MSGERPIIAPLATWAVRAVFGLVVLVAALSILVISFDIFIEDRRDTIDLSNVVFATSLAISSVTFGLARAIDRAEGERTRQRLVLSGEVLFLGSLLFLTATMLKYIASGIEARRQALRGLPSGGAVYQVILGSSRLTFAVAFAFLIAGFCLLLFHLSKHIGMR
jgi:TRAP-type C4-dicarboxylate transport system permease small subunit